MVAVMRRAVRQMLIQESRENLTDLDRNLISFFLHNCSSGGDIAIALGISPKKVSRDFLGASFRLLMCLRHLESTDDPNKELKQIEAIVLWAHGVSVDHLMRSVIQVGKSAAVRAPAVSARVAGKASARIRALLNTSTEVKHLLPSPR